MSMELQITHTTLPQIISNYNEMKFYLVENLKQYEIDVTQTNLPQAKKMATELNMLVKHIPENTFNQLVSQNTWNDTIKKQFSYYVNESVKIKNV